MDRSSRSPLLKAVFSLVLLAVLEHGASGQTNSTVSDFSNTTLTPNTTGNLVSDSNTASVTPGQTYVEDNAVPDDTQDDWEDTQSFDETVETDTSPDNLTSSAANVTGTDTTHSAESEDWGTSTTRASWEGDGVHSMSMDGTTQNTPQDNTTVGDYRYENTTSEDTPTQDSPTENATTHTTPSRLTTPTENATTHGTPSRLTTPTENTTADDAFPEEDTSPADTTPADEWSPFDSISTEAVPADDDEFTGEDGGTLPSTTSSSPSSSDLEFFPGIAENDTEDEGMDGDPLDGTFDDAAEVSVDEATNATASNETGTTLTDDDDGWENEWDVTAENSTTPEPSNVTDTSFNDTASADNVTASGEWDAANVTSSDTVFGNETKADDDEYYYDGDGDDDFEYYVDYEEVNKEDNMTSTTDKPEESDTVATDDSGDVITSNETVTSVNDTSPDDFVPSNDTVVDDVDLFNDTEEGPTQAPEKADFVVYDNRGNPCLLASLNITIHFKYTVQEGLVREMYETVSKKNTQDGSTYQGSCEEHQSSLSITWNNSTFTLNLTFAVQDKDGVKDNEIDMDVLPPGVNSSTPSWSLQQVSLSYDTANDVVFPGAYNPTVKKVSARELSLFQTPLGMAYMCRTPEVVTVEFKDVDLAFNFLHLMPFGVTSQYFSNMTVECSGDLSSVPGKEESYTVPLAVAGVLAGIVIAIVVVYATVRCVARRMRQADYKQME